jgi:hypothetical protein
MKCINKVNTKAMGIVMGYHGEFPYCKTTGVALEIVTVRARICRPLKESKNRFPA